MSSPLRTILGVAVAIGVVVAGASYKENQRRERAERNRKFEAATAEFHAESLKEMESDSLKTSTADRLDRFQATLAQAGKEGGGADAKASNVLARFMKELAQVTRALEEQSNEAVDNALFDVAKVKARKDLAERKAFSNEYISRSTALEKFVTTAENRLRELANEEKVSKVGADNLVAGFTRGASESLPLQLKIRRNERKLLGLFIKMLDILDAEWGKWKLDKDEAVEFESEKATESFGEVGESFQKALADQSEVEGQLVEMMRKKAKSK